MVAVGHAARAGSEPRFWYEVDAKMNTTGLKAVPSPAEPARSEDDRSLRPDMPFQFGDVLAILRRRAWILILAVILAIAFAAFSLARFTPLYMASAEMLLGGQGQVDRRSSDLLEERALTDTVIQGELAILQSSALLVRVVRRLGLNEDPEFNAALRPPEEPLFPLLDAAEAGLKTAAKSVLGLDRTAPAEEEAEGEGVSEGADGAAVTGGLSEAMTEAAQARGAMLGELEGAVNTLRRKLSVRQRGSSFVVGVTVTSEDPVKAAGIANAVVEEYISFVVDRRFAAAQRFTSWLETRVGELAGVLEESENEALAFQAAIDSGIDSSTRLDQQMQEMTTKLVNARTELAEAEAREAKATALLEQEGLMAAASVLPSSALLTYTAQLSELRQEERDAVRRFGEDSSQVEGVRERASATRVEMGIEVDRSLTELQNSVEVLQINVGALEDSLEALQGVILDRSREQIALNQLERVADANRRVYEDFLGRFKESREIQNLRTADAEVISYAAPPNAPALPRTRVTLILATAVGLFLGLAIVFLLELLPKRFASSEEVTPRTGLKVFGHLPRLPRRAGARRLARLLGQDDRGRLAMSARNTVRNLELALGRPMRSAMFVSHASGGDKTSLAMLIGWALAREGRSCLLVDADVRGAALTRRFALAPGPSLVDVLYDEARPEDAIRSDPDLGISILPTIPASADPATLFGTHRAGALFRELSERYDVVIVDAPPLAGLSDMVGLPNSVDLGLWVIRSNRTAIKPVVERMPLFRSLRMEIGGAILTRLSGKGARAGAAPRPAPAPASGPAAGPVSGSEARRKALPG
jgi:uncharacterized protein involved in exopolysaccharide biosynthesis